MAEAISVTQMDAAAALATTDLLYIVQGLGLDRDRKLSLSALLADPLFVNVINANEQWRTVATTFVTNTPVNLGTWERNILLNVNAPMVASVAITSAQKNAMLLIMPNWAGSLVTFEVTITLNGTAILIPNRHYLKVSFSSNGAIRATATLPYTEAPTANKTMVSGTTLEDDGYRKTQEIIVQPELTPDDGLLMTTAEILTYSENSAMKITPDWRHVVAENSLTVNVWSDGSIVGVSIPYGCSAEIAYKTNKVIANISVIPSMNYLIQTSNIKNLAVTTGKMADAAITATKLALNAVTELQILNGAVTENKHANLSVSTPKLQNGAATNVKVALTEGMEITLGTTAFDVDVNFPPANFHLGYVLVLRAGDDNPITFSYQFANTTQTVTTRAYSAAMFVCVAQATQGRQWRPIGNYSL